MQEPEKLATAWADFRQHLNNTDTGWSFWIDFTEAMRTGVGHRWNVWEAVAISPRIDWTPEPKMVNVQIAGIASEFVRNQSGDALAARKDVADLAHYRAITLMRSASLSQHIAISVDGALSQGVTSLKVALGNINQLPPELQPLENMSVQSGRIADLLNARISDQAKISRMADEILSLKSEISTLKARLETAEGKKYRMLLAESFVKALGQPLAR